MAIGGRCAVSAQLFSPPTTQRTLRSDVYDAIRQAILTGGLKPDERINEMEIARQMQISRGPIREALSQLEQEGILVGKPRRGTFVVRLLAEDVEEVYTLRADLESRAVWRALPRLADEQFATLERHLEAMRSAGRAGDLTRLLEADFQFHRTIIEATDWLRLRKIWEGLHPQTLTLYTLTTLVDWLPSRHVERHGLLLAALRGGDPATAAATMHEHILGVGKEIMQRRSPGRSPNEASTVGTARMPMAPLGVSIAAGDEQSIR